MNSSRIAVALAALTVALWGTKALAIGIAGGLDQSPAEGPLFFAGLVAFVATTVTVGIALTSGRARWLRVAGAVVAPVLGVLLALVIDSLVAAAAGPEDDRHWVWTELSLWIGCLLLLGLTLAVGRRQGTPATVG